MLLRITTCLNVTGRLCAVFLCLMLLFLSSPADAGKPEAVSSFMGVTGQGEAFPVGDLFRPLIADPKQPQFFVSLRSYRAHLSPRLA